MRHLLPIMLCIVIAGPVHGQGPCGPGGCPPGGPCPTFRYDYQQQSSGLLGRQSVRQSVTVNQPRAQLRRAAPHPSAVRIKVDRGGGFSGHGNGSIISAGLVLTCGHLFGGAQSITLTFSDGATLPATVIGSAVEHDLALLRFSPDRNRGHFVLADGSPARGQSIRWQSYWHQLSDGKPYQTYVFAEGTVTGGTASTTLYRTSPMPPESTSGGAMFNADGELIGVISEWQEEYGTSPSVEAIRAFLARYKPVPTPPEPEPLPLPIPPSPGPFPPPLPQPRCVNAIRLVQIEEQVDALDERVANLDSRIGGLSAQVMSLRLQSGEQGPQGAQGEQGPQGKPGVSPSKAEIVAAVVAELRNDPDPLFYVIHRDPKTGAIIPQTDPATGQTYEIQPINRGDDWTIYLHSARPTGATK
ncbi:MAG TPA: serine protease [Pirellulales bacterium]|nr:serine protease [Pirellulales bacterium]